MALLNTYSRFPVEFTHGAGAYLYDTSGKEYLDFLSGIAVTSFGHSHPAIKAAVTAQLDNLWHVSNLFISSAQEKLSDLLCARSGMDSLFFGNTGTEANEAAVKFARKWGKGRYKIISALNGFHGRTYGSLSATGQDKLHEGFHPLLPGFTYVPFGDISAVEQAADADTCAVMIEIIQGEGGVITASAEFWDNLQKFCEAKNMLLIIDEVQTGIGRTGKFFAYQHYGLKPDIVTSAKAIANGLPLSAVLCSSRVAEAVTPGSHGSTFGGNPAAVAAALKVQELLTDELLKYISETGDAVINGIKSFNLDEIAAVRGKGLIIGVQLKNGISAKEIAARLLSEGVVVGTSGDTVLRLLPPFIITEKEISKFLINLKNVISEYSLIKI